LPRIQGDREWELGSQKSLHGKKPVIGMMELSLACSGELVGDVSLRFAVDEVCRSGKLFDTEFAVQSRRIGVSIIARIPRILIVTNCLATTWEGRATAHIGFASA
jgi:hypothetical protein